MCVVYVVFVCAVYCEWCAFCVLYVSYVYERINKTHFLYSFLRNGSMLKTKKRTHIQSFLFFGPNILFTGRRNLCLEQNVYSLEQILSFLNKALLKNTKNLNDKSFVRGTIWIWLSKQRQNMHDYMHDTMHDNMTTTYMTTHNNIITHNDTRQSQQHRTSHTISHNIGTKELCSKEQIIYCSSEQNFYS